VILVNFGFRHPIAIFLAIYTFGTLAFWHVLVLENPLRAQFRRDQSIGGFNRSLGN